MDLIRQQLISVPRAKPCRGAGNSFHKLVHGAKLSRRNDTRSLLAQHAPTLPQAACFDTAFHHGLPDVARLFGVASALADAGVVRYGFHGLSCEFVVADYYGEARAYL